MLSVRNLIALDRRISKIIIEQKYHIENLEAAACCFTEWPFPRSPVRSPTCQGQLSVTVVLLSQELFSSEMLRELVDRAGHQYLTRGLTQKYYHLNYILMLLLFESQTYCSSFSQTIFSLSLLKQVSRIGKEGNWGILTSFKKEDKC